MDNQGSGNNNFLKSGPFRFKSGDKPVFIPRPPIVPPSPRALLRSPSPTPSPCSSPGPVPRINTTFVVPKPIKSKLPKEIPDGSLDSINDWCQNQERHNQEVQSQLDESAKELSQLKAQLATTLNDFSKIHHSYEELKESHRQINEELRGLDRFCRELKTGVGDTAKVLEEFAKDRAVWLDRFEELQRSHYDKRAELLQTDFQRRIEEKDAQMDNMRSNAEQLLAQFREAAAERDHINQQLAETKAHLDRVIQEKQRILQERNKFENDWNQLKHSFDAALKDRNTKVIEELSQEQSRNEAIRDELNSYRNKLVDIETEHQKKILEMEKVIQVGQREIASLENQIDELNSAKEETEAELIAVHKQLESQQDVLKTFSDIKSTLASVSKERAVLQERYTALEESLKSSKNALAQSEAEKERMELAMKDLTGQWQEEVQRKEEVQEQVAALDQQLKAANELVEEKSRQMEELTSQLSAADDRIRQVQEFADERVRELGDMKSQCENYEQNKSKLEKEIAELKQEQISQSIQLQYKEKKLEHMEAALKEKELQSKAPAQNVPATPTRPSASASELNELKQMVNQKNLELDAVRKQLRETREKLELAEKEIAALSSKVIILENNLEAHRQEVAGMSLATVAPSSQAEQPYIKLEAVDNVQGPFKEPFTPKIGGKAPKQPEAKAEGEKAKRLTGTPSTLKKPMSPPSVHNKPSDKRRRADTSCSPKTPRRTRSAGVNPCTPVPSSPVLSKSTKSRPAKRSSAPATTYMDVE